jgi:hypothetical protein
MLLAAWSCTESFVPGPLPSCFASTETSGGWRSAARPSQMTPLPVTAMRSLSLFSKLAQRCWWFCAGTVMITYSVLLIRYGFVDWINTGTCHFKILLTCEIYNWSHLIVSGVWLWSAFEPVVAVRQKRGRCCRTKQQWFQSRTFWTCRTRSGKILQGLTIRTSFGSGSGLKWYVRYTRYTL